MATLAANMRGTSHESHCSGGGGLKGGCGGRDIGILLDIWRWWTVAHRQREEMDNGERERELARDIWFWMVKNGSLEGEVVNLGNFPAN